MHPRERLAYSPIEGRPPLKFPNGVRMVIWPVLALEEWDMSRPMARMVISPPQGQPHAARPSELELARIRHARRLLAAASKLFERARRDADLYAQRARLRDLSAAW